MTPVLAITPAVMLYFRLYPGGMRLHSVMLHRVLKARGLGDALCNLPCQYPLPTSAAVMRDLSADRVLLNLKCDADSPSAFSSSICFPFLQHVAKPHCVHPQEMYSQGVCHKDSLVMCQGNAFLQRQQ